MTVMLYKNPGDTLLPQHGGNFDLFVVDENAVDQALAEGWSLTPAEALDAGAVAENEEPEPSEVLGSPRRRGRKPKAETD